MTKKIEAIWQAVAVPVSAALFFLAVCLCSSGTIKGMTLMLIPLTLTLSLLYFSRLRDRIRLPLFALGLVVLAGGLSNLYAVSGKFALSEFLKLLDAFCLTLILLVFAGEARPEREIASVLSGCTALSGLVSIDLLSTRLISTPVLALLTRFGRDFSGLVPIEEGVRMISIFVNSNVFAGCSGIGVLLGLGLASSAKGKAERAAHLVVLFVNALSFVLAFSMGASAMISLAFLAYLALETRGERISRLLLMAETLAVTLLAAFPISQTAFSRWTGFQPVPLLCLAAGAVLLCLLDVFVGQRAAERLRGHGRAVFAVSAGIFAGVALFAVVACSLTGGVTLHENGQLRRAAYPAPGTYTMAAEADGEIQLLIESQNRVETQMHTSTVLYTGPLAGAGFTVPEGSEVVYFTFSAALPVRLEQAGYEGPDGAGRIPLKYRLLPGFIANRLQGLRANENAIQRLTFFEDGLKLFWRSPLIGQGLGVFGSASAGVQSFEYMTRYVHNHYIQTLDETGIVGLALFLGLLGISAAAVWRARGQNGLVPALGAALVFMAGHAAVEIVFSTYCYLPVAFGTFGLISLCGGDTLAVRLEGRRLRSGLLLSGMVLAVLFEGLLLCNVYAARLAERPGDLSRYELAARLDRFEWADHLLSYVMGSLAPGTEEAVRQKADGYALRLSEQNSNIIPLRLAEYYFATDRPGQAFTELREYLVYTSADTGSWQNAFDLLEKYEDGTASYRDETLGIVRMMEDWNGRNLGTITLTGRNEAFLERMAAG